MNCVQEVNYSKSTFPCLWFLVVLRIHKEKRFSEKAAAISENLDAKFKKKKIWDLIQTFFSSHGNFRMKNLELEVREEIKENNPGCTPEELEQKVRCLLKPAGCYTSEPRELARYHTDKAEQTIDAHLSRLMADRPGLMVRGLKCQDKKTFQHLRDILGDIAPNCESQCQEGEHFNQLNVTSLFFIFNNHHPLFRDGVIWCYYCSVYQWDHHNYCSIKINNFFLYKI